jgi:hypothetical protein
MARRSFQFFGPYEFHLRLIFLVHASPYGYYMFHQSVLWSSDWNRSSKGGTPTHGKPHKT